jgi:hypothetical protein
MNFLDIFVLDHPQLIVLIVCISSILIAIGGFCLLQFLTERKKITSKLHYILIPILVITVGSFLMFGCKLFSDQLDIKTTSYIGKYRIRLSYGKIYIDHKEFFSYSYLSRDLSGVYTKVESHNFQEDDTIECSINGIHVKESICWKMVLSLSEKELVSSSIR